ncbi:MAG: hypothetical protein AAGM84_10370 [Pseudomonadota bacterium]
MFRPLALAALTAAFALPASAQSFQAENDLTVNAVPGGFEVIESGSFGARSIWCAASDYAQDVLGVAGTSRLYVLSPRGAAQTAPGRKGVTFTTDASAVSPVQTLVLGSSIRTPGSNLSVDHSYQFCYDRRLINSR